MTIHDARALRDIIREKCKVHCVVPLGHKPDGYFARIFLGHGQRLTLIVGETHGDKTRIAFDGPREFHVLRGELMPDEGREVKAA